jgi:hypothetical protein
VFSWTSLALLAAVWRKNTAERRPNTASGVAAAPRYFLLTRFGVFPRRQEEHEDDHHFD